MGQPLHIAYEFFYFVEETGGFRFRYTISGKAVASEST